MVDPELIERLKNQAKGDEWHCAALAVKALERLERERDEARRRFNDIDLCQNAQAPCEWSLKLISERDEALKALREHPPINHGPIDKRTYREWLRRMYDALAKHNGGREDKP